MYVFMLSLKHAKTGHYVAVAGLFGLVLGTKFNGLLILPVMALVFLMYRLARVRERTGKLDREIVVKNIGYIFPLAGIVMFVAIAAMVFVAIWPWLWTDPAGHMARSLDHWTYTVQEYFLGVEQSPPLYYYPAYFIVTLPVLLFLPLALGAVETVKSRDAFKIGVLIWFVIPFAYNFSDVIMGGMRYVMLIYPAVALLCGYGICRLAGVAGKWLGKYRLTDRQVFYGLTGITGIYLLVTAALVSPYYLDYYNAVAGGPQNVQEHKLFLFSWWGEGISESMEWVDNNARPGSTVMMLVEPEDPANTGFFTGSMRYIYPWMSKTNGANKAYNFTAEPYMIPTDNGSIAVVPDYVVFNAEITYQLDITFNDTAYDLVYTPVVEGAPLVYVYMNRNAG